MKDNKRFTVQQLGNNKMGVYEISTGNQIAIYLTSDYATYMQNAKFASDMIEAYEQYMQSIEKLYKNRQRKYN